MEDYEDHEKEILAHSTDNVVDLLGHFGRIQLNIRYRDPTKSGEVH